MSGGTGQDEDSVAQNAEFFDGNSRYAGRVGSLDTYRNIRAAINRAISGAGTLLDVGNGGVFDYDTGLAGEIVAVDLFVGGEPGAHLPSNVTLRRGDALALEEHDGVYDTVLQVSVFHHLVGTNVQGTLANIQTAIAESHRVLQPGGRLVVMESCVSPLAYAVERRLFGALRRVASSGFMSHPATLQFPPATIAQLIGERFDDVEVEEIPVGRWIIQFGARWPSALTPARPYLFVAARSGEARPHEPAR